MGDVVASLGYANERMEVVFVPYSLHLDSNCGYFLASHVPSSCIDLCISYIFSLASYVDLFGIIGCPLSCIYGSWLVSSCVCPIHCLFVDAAVLFASMHPARDTHIAKVTDIACGACE